MEGNVMRRQLLTIMLVLVSVTACAYPQYVNDDYRYVPLTSFAFENRSFRIFDKPSAGKMIITPSLSTAMSDVMIRNATFGEYNNTTERQTLERAVEAYLSSLGRKCALTGASLMYDPQWEFTYDCEIRYTAIP
jgi:hypothetical protein